MRGAESGSRNLNFPFGALDPDRWVRGVVAVRVSRDAKSSESDAVGSLLASRGGGKGEQYGSLFVGAGGILFDRGYDGGWPSLRCWDCMVDALETPSERVDSQIEHSTTSQVDVDHPMFCSIRAPCILYILAKAQIGNHAMHSSKSSVFNHFSDLNTQWKEPRPHGLH